MANVPFSEARTHLTDIVNEVAYGGERIILTRKGKQLVAIIPLEDLRALEAIENKIDLEDAKKALRDVEKHGTISWEDTKRELGL
jgi:prevent-host-death family protein